MMLIGLLLVALACIVLGIVFASGPWFIGSLVASALAAYLLWRQRDQISGRGSASKGQSTDRPSGQPAAASRQTSLVTGTAFAGKIDDSAPTSAAAGRDGQVWVVDGQPQYHAADCGRLDGEQSEAVPFAQAVEDGFVECEFCHPVLAAHATQVSVVDGQPEYHRADCRRIAGADHEQIPRAQATGDGFIPCTVCKPDDDDDPTGGAAEAASAPSSEPAVGHRPSPDPDNVVDGDAGESAEPASVARPPAPVAAGAAAAGPAGVAESAPVAGPAGVAESAVPDAAARAAGATGDVWVVDGRPRYHLADCLIIKGQPAEAIPLEQATEDGFMPCTMCEPNVTRV